MKLQSPLALVLLALVGCSGQVIDEAGATSAASSSSGAGGGQTTGEGGAGVGGGGSAVCKPQPEDEVDWSIDYDGGKHFDPSVEPMAKVGDTWDETFDGEVVEASPGHLTIDTCPPNADCAGTLVKIAVAPKAAAFDAGIPLHTFVHVHLVTQVVGYNPGGQKPFRTLLLQIDNLAVWGGIPSAIEAGSDVWLIASDAGVPQQEGAVGGLGVNYDKACERDPQTYYELGTLTFRDVAVPGTKIKLQQGEQGVLTLASSPRPLLIRNVDSSIEFIEGAWGPDFLVRRALPTD